LTALTIILLGWPFYASLALLLLPFLVRRARAWDALHGAIAGLFILAYVGLYYHGIAFGPRYYFDALPSLILLTARGFVALAAAVATLLHAFGRADAWPRARAASLGLAAILIACNLIYFLPRQVQLYSPLARRVGTGPELGDVVERRLAGRVVDRPNAVIATRDRSVYWLVFGSMNCPTLDCATIFAYVPDDATEQRLRAAFPGRAWYFVEDNGGVLVLRSADASALVARP
jgi:hypothetical protein